MTWYAAHIVMFVKLKKPDKQSEFPVWENVVLIKAASEESAFSKAEELGRADEGDDDGAFKWDGAPAEWKFAGVRKLTLCEDSSERPHDLTEITYIEMTARSEKAIRDMVDGKQATVKLRDTCRETQEVN